MNNLDLLLLIITLLSAVIGLMRGLFREVFSLITLLGAYLVATYFAPSMSGALVNQFGNETLRYWVAFGVLFVGTMIVGGLLNYLGRELLTGSGLSGTDRFFGFVFGALRGALVCLILLIAIRGFFEDQSWWQESRIGPILLGFEEVALDWLGRAGSAVGELNEAAKPPTKD